MVRQIFDDEHGDSNGDDDDTPMSCFDVNSWWDLLRDVPF